MYRFVSTFYKSDACFKYFMLDPKRNRKSDMKDLDGHVSTGNKTPIQTVRIVMFGLGGVGKTSLIHRFLFSKFDSAYTATIEDDYRQVITYNNHIVDVTVLDTAGSYQFPAMRKHAIQNGQGFLLVYAMDSKKSLDEVNRIYSEIKTVKGHDNVPVIVVGNKLDKCSAGKQKVQKQHINEMLDSWGRCVEHIETSAKLDKNVSLLFNKMIWIIDEVRFEKQGPSVDFTTIYDQTCKNSTIPNRTYSVNHSPINQSYDHNTKSPTRARSVDYNLKKKETGYRGRLHHWEETATEKDSDNVDKKQVFLRKMFTRKSVS